MSIFETVFDQIWTLLDGHAGLNSPVIVKRWKFESSEEVPPSNPDTNQLPDLIVLFMGGPALNLVSEATGPWRPELLYNIRARTDTMNPRTSMTILDEILKALTASSTNYNLGLGASGVTMVNFTDISVEPEESEESRWAVDIQMVVHVNKAFV